jgi:hypothetical protein
MALSAKDFEVFGTSKCDKEIAEVRNKITQEKGKEVERGIRKTAPRYRTFISKKEIPHLFYSEELANLFTFRVPGIGVEPIRYCYHWCLRPARLPIPPPGHYLRKANIIEIGRPKIVFLKDRKDLLNDHFFA